MNSQSPTPKSGLHRSFRVLFLLSLQHALVPAGPMAQARSRSSANSEWNPAAEAGSRPYLKIAGSPPLRFSAAPRLVASLPIKLPATGAIASDNAAKESSSPPAPFPLTPNPELNNSPSEQTALPITPIGNKPALSILPDDTHPSTRPEDFLPFFQFPASGDVTVVVPASAARSPAPAQMPVSSATYQQR